jgi:hypothetical protein
VSAKNRNSGQAPSLEPPLPALCALQTRDGYAVEATTFGTDIRPGLTVSLAGKATVYDAPGGFGYDADVFMKIGASAKDTDAVRSALQSDPVVETFQFVSPTDAYAIFKKDFANQPALVESTKPGDLPASFRILLEPGRSKTAFEARYRSATGVDMIISGNAQTLFRPGNEASFGISPCGTP